MPLNAIETATEIDTSDNFLPVITSLADGDYVIAYTHFDSNAGTDVLLAPVFDSTGQQVGTATVSQPIFIPASFSVGGLTGGGFALAWDGDDFFETGGSGIGTGVFTATGQPTATAREVDPSSVPNDVAPAVIPLAGGGYALTWTDESNPNGFNVFTAAFDAQGNQVQPATDISNVAAGDTASTSAAPFAGTAAGVNGGYAMAWVQGQVGANARDVFLAVFDPQNQEIGTPIDVSGPIVGGVPRIAALSNGDYALTWHAEDINSNFAVFTAVYDAAGQQVSAPAQIAPGEFPEISALANGRFAVVWGSGSGVETAVFDEQGQQLSATVVLDPNGSVFSEPSVVTLSNGDYAAAWGDPNGEIFTAACDAQGNEIAGPVDVGQGSFAPQLTALQNGAYALLWQSDNPNTPDFPNEYDTFSAIYQVTGGSTVPDINLVGSGEIDVDLSAVFNVDGDVTISNNGSLVSIDLSNLLSVGGNFVLSDNGALLTIDLPSLTAVAGSVIISDDTSATAIDARSLTTAGSVEISGDTAATTIDAASLATVSGSVIISDDTSATAIDARSLTTAGSVDISGDISATTINLGALVQAGAIVIANNGVVTLDLSNLTHAGGDVEINNNTYLLSVDFPSLTDVDGSVSVTGDSAATTVDLDSLVQVTGGVTIADNSNATSIVLDSLTSTTGGVTVTDNSNATSIVLDSLTSTTGDVTVTDNSAATTVDMSSLVSTTGDVTITSGADATLDASALGPGGGQVRLIGDNLTTTITLGSLAHLGGTLTIASADGVTLEAHAGLAALTITGTGGDDTLIGSTTATDTAVYSGNRDDYAIAQNPDGSLTVADTRAGAPDGIDTLTNFELFQFADGTLTAAHLFNQSPVITSNGGGDAAAVSVAENTAAVTTVAATDEDAAQTLGFSIIPVADGGGADAALFTIDAGTGALSFLAAPNFEAPADAGGNNIYDVTVQVSDGHGGIDAQAIAVTVTDVNESPIAADDIAGVTRERTGSVDAAHGVLANDTDPDGDALSVGAVDGLAANVGHDVLGRYGVLTLNADGSYSYLAKLRHDDGGDRCDDGHDDADHGYGRSHAVAQDTFTYTVSDSHGGTDTATLTITLLDHDQKYLRGTDGADTLLSGKQANVLDGGNGDDTLSGGKAGDVLIGGNGNDLFAGGKGADAFIFKQGFGNDVIADFKPHEDFIQFDHALFADFNDVLSHATEDGLGNTVITLDANDAVTLQHVALANLHAHDFLLV